MIKNLSKNKDKFKEPSNLKESIWKNSKKKNQIK